MQHTLKLLLATALLGVAAPAASRAQDPAQVAVPVYSAEELDNLLAAIALYPDPILAQVLVAATFPDQVEFAADYVRANGTRGIDDQAWDVSVKAIAHYPPVLNLLADRPDWTTALGQAYAVQSSDVMESVQRLRHMAHEQGNLVSTPEQRVVVQNQTIVIEPAQPRVVYVPTYDPDVIYYRPVRIVGPYTGYWSFGIGFPIGVWLTYDVDWYGRRIYYDGWYGGGWRLAARPYIVLNPIYVYPRTRVVYINTDIIHRRVNWVNLGRYNRIHRTVRWDRPDRERRYTDFRRGDNRDGRYRDDDRTRDGRQDPRRAGGPDNRPGSRTAVPRTAVRAPEGSAPRAQPGGGPARPAATRSPGAVTSRTPAVRPTPGARPAAPVVRAERAAAGARERASQREGSVNQGPARARATQPTVRPVAPAVQGRTSPSARPPASAVQRSRPAPAARASIAPATRESRPAPAARSPAGGSARESRPAPAARSAASGSARESRPALAQRSAPAQRSASARGARGG